jgi:hypothetical protein
VPDPTPEELATLTAATDAAATAKAEADKTAAAAAKAAEDDPKNWDKDRAARTIAAQRESEAKLKAELALAKADQAKLADIEAAKLSAEERAVAEAAAAKETAASAVDQLRRGYLLAELAKAPVVDAETAAALISGVEYGEDGKPTNLDTRLEVLLAEKAFLKADAARVVAPNINSGGGSGDGPPPTLTVEEARAAQDAGMDPAHYAALKTIDQASNQFEAWQQIQAARKAAGAAKT